MDFISGQLPVMKEEIISSIDEFATIKIAEEKNPDQKIEEGIIFKSFHIASNIKFNQNIF
jgi:hypothetical protein